MWPTDEQIPSLKIRLSVFCRDFTKATKKLYSLRKNHRYSLNVPFATVGGVSVLRFSTVALGSADGEESKSRVLKAELDWSRREKTKLLIARIIMQDVLFHFPMSSGCSRSFTLEQSHSKEEGHETKRLISIYSCHSCIPYWSRAEGLLSPSGPLILSVS